MTDNEIMKETEDFIVLDGEDCSEAISPSASKQVDTEATKLAKQYNVSKDEFLAHSGGVEAIRYDLMIAKVIEIIKGEEK